MAVDMLEIGKSGLFSSKKSLQTSGHNVANVNTEGYSRQRAIQSQNVPIGSGDLIYGTGSHIKTIQRVHSDYVEKSLTSSMSEHSYNANRSRQLSELEGIFNEINNEGLNQILNKFFNSFRELSTQPESKTVRSMVRENAKILIRELKRARNGLNNAAKTIDRMFDEAVYDINSALKEISVLNVKIRELEALEGESGDLRDQRDLAVRNLSDFFAIETYTDNKGHYIVNAKGVGTLVSGHIIQEVKTGSPPGNEYIPGSREIYIESNPNSPITAKFSQGKMAALFETRDSEIKLMQDKVDSLAWQTANAVNAIHRKGYINTPATLDPQGNPTGPQKFSGIDFFEIPKDKLRAAEYIDLSAEVKEDLVNIVSALHPNSPGDNRVAIAISKLPQEPISGNASKTLEEDYLEGVGIVSLAASKARLNEEQSDGILAQTKSLKERLSGVSIDEESANLLRYQQAYEACARVIRVSDEMFKAVLALKP